MRARCVVSLLPERIEKTAASSSSFFKTGEGEYAAGDIFLGVTVPTIRTLIRQYDMLPKSEVILLLQDPAHECRLAALLILVEQFKRGDERERASIAAVYLQHLDHVNNWDLVDSSAAPILGEYSVKRSRKILHTLARSRQLWRERVSIVATHAFIRRNEFGDTLSLCKYFLSHKHDLLHKACGWMLREVGKRDKAALNTFLDEHAAYMPRTMLRYALEKHQLHEKQLYMAAAKKK